MALTKEDLQAIGELMDEKLDTRLKPIQDDITDIKDRVINIEDRVYSIEGRVLNIELTQENKILPGIQLLAEGHGGVIDRLDRLEELPLPEKVDDIQRTVSVLKIAVKDRVQET